MSERSGDWIPERPCCPECGRPRLAECPYCQTSSAEFPWADSDPIAETEGEPWMVLCSLCDEPFRPEYLPRCEWCGHSFVELSEPLENSLAPDQSDPEQGDFVVDVRVAVTVLGLVVLGGLLLWYFYALIP